MSACLIVFDHNVMVLVPTGRLNPSARLLTSVQQKAGLIMIADLDRVETFNPLFRFLLCRIKRRELRWPDRHTVSDSMMVDNTPIQTHNG